MPLFDAHGRPLTRRIELDPRGSKGALITAPKGLPTRLLVDGTQDEFLLPAGTQWHIVPERTWQGLLRDRLNLAHQLRELGIDADDDSAGLAASMLTASMARKAQGVD